MSGEIMSGEIMSGEIISGEIVSDRIISGGGDNAFFSCAVCVPFFRLTVAILGYKPFDNLTSSREYDRMGTECGKGSCDGAGESMLCKVLQTVVFRGRESKHDRGFGHLGSLYPLKRPPPPESSWIDGGDRPTSADSDLQGVMIMLVVHWPGEESRQSIPCFEEVQTIWTSGFRERGDASGGRARSRWCWMLRRQHPTVTRRAYYS